MELERVPRPMCYHHQSNSSKFILESKVDGTEPFEVIRQLAVHGEEEVHGPGLILHRCHVEGRVLKLRFER